MILCRFLIKVLVSTHPSNPQSTAHSLQPTRVRLEATDMSHSAVFWLTPCNLHHTRVECSRNYFQGRNFNDGNKHFAENLISIRGKSLPIDAVLNYKRTIRHSTFWPTMGHLTQYHLCPSRCPESSQGIFNFPLFCISLVFHRFYGGEDRSGQH